MKLSRAQLNDLDRQGSVVRQKDQLADFSAAIRESQASQDKTVSAVVQLGEVIARSVKESQTMAERILEEQLKRLNEIAERQNRPVRYDIHRGKNQLADYIVARPE